MIQLTTHMRIFVATSPIDMRKGIDGVALICRTRLGANPMSGAIFVFTNRSRKMIRLLTYDGQGYWLATKRLSQGRFPFWPLAGTAEVTGWGAAALRVPLRDELIGWDFETKRHRLHLVANNVRFLILPHVRIKNLGSRILSLNLKRLSRGRAS